MSKNKKTKVRLASVISKNLMLRVSANELFRHINEIDSDKIIMDFSKIQSVTRAFAHQYLMNKDKSGKRIIDVNMSPQIKPMFEIVGNTINNSCIS